MWGGPLWAAALLSVASMKAEYYDGDMWSRSRENDHKIINGQDAELKQFPHHALLVMDDGSFCGGSLINVKSILTAAHCVCGKRHITVRLGGIRRYEPEPFVWIRVATYYKPYPHYDPTYLNDDIAIVPLPEAPPLTTDYIKMVKLPSESEVNETFVGSHPRFSGFGYTTFGGVLPEILQCTQLWVIPNDVCISFYLPGDILEGSLCTFDEHTGACFGDSGGALVIVSEGLYKQIGVLSFVAPKCELYMPDGYARVTYFLSWIKANW